MTLNYPLLQFEHLSQRDIELLSRIAEVPEESVRALLARDPGWIDRALAAPALFEAIFGESDGLGPIVTPFLAFGALVHHAEEDLGRSTHLLEWSGPGKRLPVFDVAPLRDYLGDGGRRFFLIEHLASFTKVASGTFWVRTRRGYARRRFSEVDPVRLADLVEQLPLEQRPGGYRRLGDVALFLSGVFPDHTARHPLPVSQRERLARSAAIGPTDALVEGDGIGFLEKVGAGWYRKAVGEAEAMVGIGPSFLRDVADRFADARRILNYLADRYLFRRDLGLIRPGG
jgi:hypothetical protein